MTTACAIPGKAPKDMSLPQGTVEVPGGIVQKTPEQWHSDPTEMRRSWQAAQVRLPDENGGVVNTTLKSLENRQADASALLPAIVYMHGCGGFWDASWFRLDWFAKQGFAVFAPDSFARAFYPRSCDPASLRSGLYRHTLTMRHHDLAYAIEQVRSMPWIDARRIILVGVSEGAAVVTTFDNTDRVDHKVALRISEAWTCQSGWDEYRGINAPRSEPVLTLVADRDRWYNNQWQYGDCGEFISTLNGSVSHVVIESPLKFNHYLLEEPQIQEFVIDFLRNNGFDG